MGDLGPRGERKDFALYIHVSAAGGRAVGGGQEEEADGTDEPRAPGWTCTGWIELKHGSRSWTINQYC
jgi:hypothetical protein